MALVVAIALALRGAAAAGCTVGSRHTQGNRLAFPAQELESQDTAVEVYHALEIPDRVMHRTHTGSGVNGHARHLAQLLLPFPSRLGRPPPAPHAPGFEGRGVRLEIAPHLVQGIAAELLDHSPGQLKGDRRLSYDRRGWDGADV